MKAKLDSIFQSTFQTVNDDQVLVVTNLAGATAFPQRKNGQLAVLSPPTSTRTYKVAYGLCQIGTRSVAGGRLHSMYWCSQPNPRHHQSDYITISTLTTL